MAQMRINDKRASINNEQQSADEIKGPSERNDLLQKQRLLARTVQQSPIDTPSQVITNEQFYKLIQEHNANNSIPFDDAIISKLEASPYRQKLYFKKLYQKNGHQRAPSVQQMPNGGMIYQNPIFPPAEYFNNMKSIQMRHTQQEGGFKQVKTQRNSAIRSNSLLGQRVKQLNGMASPPRIQIQQSLLPQTIANKMPQASIIQSSVHTSQNDNNIENDYQTQSKISSRGIRFYNRVVEKFENKFYQSKTRPSSIKKEEIYDENIQLKHQINQLKEHLTLQKTQNKLLNNELEKQQQLMVQVLGQQAQGVGPAQVGLEENTVKQSELIGNLKRELDKALKDLIDKENEIKNINKSVKVTKYKELEEECKMYMNECFRLHRVLKKFLIQSGMARNSFHTNSQENFDISHVDDKKDNDNDKLRYLKNMNSKLTEEVKAHTSRYEIQSQQIKSLQQQLQKQALELEQQKPLLEQNKTLKQEIDKLKVSPVKVLEQPQKQATSLKDDPKFKQMKSNLDRLEQDVIVLRQENGKLKDQNEDSEKTIISLEQQLANLRQEHIQDIKKAQEQSFKLEQNIQNLQTQLNNQQTQNQQLQQQLTATINTQNQTKSSKEQELQKQKEILESKVSAQHNEITTLQIEKMKLKGELETKVNDIKAQYESKVVNQVSENNQKDLIIIKLKEQIEQFKSQPDQTGIVSLLNKQLADKDTLISMLNQNIDELKDQGIAAQNEYAKMKANLSLYMSEVETLKARVPDVVHDNQNEQILKTQLDQHTSQIQDLKEQITLKDSQIKDFQKQIKDNYLEHQEDLRKKVEELDALTEEIESLQKQINLFEQDKANQGKEDSELMKKLEQLMVSLQLKEKDMQAQTTTIDSLKNKLDEKDNEITQLESQLNDKDFEISTVKDYFEKKQDENEKLLKEIDSIKQLQSLLKNQENLQPEIQKLQSEIQRITSELETEQKNHLNDIEIRFQRCLEILQINDTKGLSNFLKAALSEKNSEEDLEEYISMKFNMNISEATLFLKKVLGLTGDFSKQDVIDRFIKKVGRKVHLLEKDQVIAAYKELSLHIIDSHFSVQDFLSQNNIDSARVMHFYLVEKMINQALAKSTLKLQQFTKEKLVNILITHLLSQSRNFYQIETRILKEYLTKYDQSAQSEINKNNNFKAPEKQTTEIQNPQPEQEEEEYEYYEELDEEERKLMIEEEKHKDETFGKAIKQMQDVKHSELKETNQSIQLNTQPDLLLTERAKSSPRKSIKQQEDQVLQQIAQFLVNRKINLRQFLKVYHVDPKDIAFMTKEIEALKLSELIDFVKQQEIFRDPEQEALIDEDIEKSLIKAKCLHTVEALNLQVVEHQGLVDLLSQWGYQDHAQLKSAKNFDVSILDLKSIRLVNRITQTVYKEVEKFITQNHINVQLTKEQNATLLEQVVENLFKSVLKKTLIHSNNQKQQVYLIQMDNFYSKLVEMGLKKKRTQISALSLFLQLNAENSQSVYVKKLIKLVEIFNKSSLMNAIGTKKIKLVEKTLRNKSQVKIVYQDEVNEEQKVPIDQNHKVQQPEEEYDYTYGYEYGEETQKTVTDLQKDASPVVHRPIPMPPQQQQILLDLLALEPPRPISQGKSKQLEEQRIVEEEMEEYYEYYDEDESPKK